MGWLVHKRTCTKPNFDARSYRPWALKAAQHKQCLETCSQQHLCCDQFACLQLASLIYIKPNCRWILIQLSHTFVLCPCMGPQDGPWTLVLRAFPHEKSMKKIPGSLLDLHRHGGGQTHGLKSQRSYRISKMLVPWYIGMICSYFWPSNLNKKQKQKQNKTK